MRNAAPRLLRGLPSEPAQRPRPAQQLRKFLTNLGSIRLLRLHAAGSPAACSGAATRRTSKAEREVPTAADPGNKLRVRRPLLLRGGGFGVAGWPATALEVRPMRKPGASTLRLQQQMGPGSLEPSWQRRAEGTAVRTQGQVDQAQPPLSSPVRPAFTRHRHLPRKPQRSAIASIRPHTTQRHLATAAASQLTWYRSPVARAADWDARRSRGMKPGARD